MLFALLFTNAAWFTLAQSAPIEWGPPIGTAALFSTTLGWFMFRLERKLEESSIANSHLARANYLVLLGLRQIDANLKEDARKGLDELDGKKKNL